jgi:hypothetical protein
MRRFHWFVAVLLAASLAAAQPTRTLKWDQLAGVITGQPLVVELKDSGNVKGVPISVEATALALNVTSNSHPTYKRGQASIPRSEIAGLRVVTSGHAGRIGLGLGLAAGAGGAAGIYYANANCRPQLFFGETCASIGGAALAGFVGLLSAAPVTGYFIGRHLDRHESRITVLPD